MKYVSINCFYIVLFSLAYSLGNPRVRPAAWAQPLIQTDVKNFYQVSPKLYRSAQPDASGFKEMETLGLRYVLNLRSLHTDTDEAKATNLELHQVQMHAQSITYQQLVQALKIIRRADGPILVHCWHGADRTGAVVAAYRIAFQSWSPEKAVDELMNGGFNFHTTFKSIPRLILSLDPEQLKKDAGILQ